MPDDNKPRVMRGSMMIEGPNTDVIKHIPVILEAALGAPDPCEGLIATMASVQALVTMLAKHLDEDPKELFSFFIGEAAKYKVSSVNGQPDLEAELRETGKRIAGHIIHLSGDKSGKPD